jgi:hypothetical protein
MLAARASMIEPAILGDVSCVFSEGGGRGWIKLRAVKVVPLVAGE